MVKYTLDGCEDIDNLTIAQSIDKILKNAIYDTNNFVIEINKHDLNISIYAKEKIEKTKLSKEALVDNSTILQSDLKEDVKRIEETMSFMIAETVVEYWLKFGVNYFYIETRVEHDRSLKIFFNTHFDDKRFNAYWKNHNLDGWNTLGKFFHREWVKPEHQDVLGGGKTNAK